MNPIVSDLHTEIAKQIGYCTNVHAGTTLEEVKQNLSRHAVEVRQLCPSYASSHLPVGLWLSDSVTQELDDAQMDAFGQWLDDHRLSPYTFNGFPFSDFHQPVVKRDVYLPTLADPKRTEYLIRLANILDRWLPEGEKGTISTLPIGWPIVSKTQSEDWLTGGNRPTAEASAEQLIQLATKLADLESRRGRLIQICLEPEPGCLLDCADDIVRFFNDVLLPTSDQRKIPNALIRRHIAVCHDVCHSSVKFEPQREAIQSYRNSGIKIGKVQISSAPEVNFDASNSGTAWLSSKLRLQLQQFAEPKYLHQSSFIDTLDLQQEGVEPRFWEDLPECLAWLDNNDPERGKIRVHFHVPIFQERLDELDTTQADIRLCLESLTAELQSDDPASVPHLEVETYAWNVLPASLQPESLAAGIAKEIQWVQDLLHRQT